MKSSLLEIIICPSCKKELELSELILENKSSGQANRQLSGVDVNTGLLECKCGKIYPVIDGVPRLMKGGIVNFPQFIKQFNKETNRFSGLRFIDYSYSPKSSQEDDYANIRKSFSQEWEIFDYNHDKTWGWSLEERKAVFLDDIKKAASELVGKQILDAGCGNGTLTAAISDFGPIVIGLDLNDGLGLAYFNRCKYGKNAGDNVQFVQGNLAMPPFKEGSYDIIYSSGVIHHTPSSKDTFTRLAPMLKKGGRLYVWVYGKRALPVRVFFGLGRSLKRVISLNSLLKFCRFLAPIYKVASDILDKLKIVPFRGRSKKEITLDLFDAFAPRYNHWHTENEVRSWFKESGFRNINLSGKQKHGFGMYGDKI